MNHPIVALWAHPRSMSTATERVMLERGDCTVFHEPFLADYYLHRALRPMPMLEAKRAGTKDYVAMRAEILAAGERGPVFFKDMSYYVLPRMFDDRAFAARLCNVFLVRDPRRSIASYARLDPDFTDEEVGLEAQWRHAVFLRDAMGAAPIVIAAEALAEDPQRVIGKVWARAGLPFVASAFSWQAGEVPEAWEYVAGWHGAAVNSTGIRRDETDPEEAFKAAADKLPRLRGYLAHHWPFYARLMEMAESDAE